MSALRAEAERGLAFPRAWVLSGFLFFRYVNKNSEKTRLICKAEQEINKLGWPETESNHRHEDFQSTALPTELPGREVGY